MYCTCVVRSILEYNSIIWNPTTEHLINKIGNIQNRFLRFMALKINTPTTGISTPMTARGVNGLAKRRLFNDISFIHKLLNNNVDCPGFTG